MTAILTQVQTAIANGNAYYAAGDYASAKSEYLQAQALGAGFAEGTRNLAGGGSQSLAMKNLAILDKLIAACDRMLNAAVHAASGPFQQIPVEYVKPDAEDDYS